MPKRFFVQGTLDLQKRLQHLAIELDTSAEKLGAQLLAEFLPTVEADVKAGKRKPPQRK